MERTERATRVPMGRALLVAAVAAGAWMLLLVAAPAGRAAEYLYFAANPLASSKVFRVDQAQTAGGSATELGPASTSPFSLAVSSTYLYTAGTSSIVRYGLDGLNPTTLPFTPCQGNTTGATGFVPQSLAINATHLFYACRDISTNTTEAIGRAGLDGTNPEPNYMPLDSDSDGILHLRANATHLFFTQSKGGSDRKIGKAAIGDISTKQMVSVTTGLTAGSYNFQGLALTSSHVYWTLMSGAADQIGRSTVALGDQQNSFIAPGTSSQVGPIAASSSYLFWRSSGSPEVIVRAPVAGGSSNPPFITLSAGAVVQALGVAYAADAPPAPVVPSSPSTTPTAAAPAPTVKTSGLKARTPLKRTGPRLTAAVDCTTTNAATLTSCTVELVVPSSTLKQGKAAKGKATVIGRATKASATGAATIAVTVGITNKAAKRILSTNGRLRATVRITATSIAGQAGTANRATTLVAPAKAAKAAFRR